MSRERRRPGQRLLAKDPREVERSDAMKSALENVRGFSAGKSARGPAARGRQRSVFS